MARYALFILQLLAPIVALSLGIIALLGNHRTRDGRLNRRGRLTLAGLVASCVIGIATEMIQFKNRRDESRDAAEAVRKTIFLAKSALAPITGWKVRARWALQDTSTYFKPCLSVVRRWLKLHPYSQDLFDLGPPPACNAEALVGTTLNLLFYSHQTVADTCTRVEPGLVGLGQPGSDLELQVAFDPSAAALTVDVHGDTLVENNSYFLETDWHQGIIGMDRYMFRSLPDLAGACLLVVQTAPGFLADRTLKGIASFYAATPLDTLYIDYGAAVPYRITAYAAERTLLNGTVSYYTFPDSLAK